MDAKTRHSNDLKDVRWLKRRIGILIKHNFKCDMCGDDWFLQVHHKKYRNWKRLWEYDDDELMCLCGNCHEYQHGGPSLNLKGDYLLLPLKYDYERGAYGLPAVGHIFNAENIDPMQKAYLVVIPRGKLEKVIGEKALMGDIATIKIDANGGIGYAEISEPFLADSLYSCSGNGTIMEKILDNKTFDVSYIEFTNLPSFAYDIAVVTTKEEKETGWHRGRLEGVSIM